MYALGDCKVTGTNKDVQDAPETVNQDAEGKGWLLEVTVTNEQALKDHMDSAKYEAYIKDL